jgi:hypothetical protein
MFITLSKPTSVVLNINLRSYGFRLSSTSPSYNTLVLSLKNYAASVFMLVETCASYVSLSSILLLLSTSCLRKLDSRVRQSSSKQSNPSANFSTDFELAQIVRLSMKILKIVDLIRSKVAQLSD